MRGNLTGFIAAALLFVSLLAAPGLALGVDDPPEDSTEMVQVKPQVTASLVEEASVQTSPAPLVGDALLPLDTHGPSARWISPEISAAPEPGFLDTSRFLMGSVAYALIMPESNGTVDVNQEDWTAAEIASVSSEVQAGVTWWAAQELNASLSFSYDPLSPRVVNTSYEPITRPSTDEGLWITEAMAQLGYTTGSYFDRVRQFDNDLRTAMGTDWAFTLFVVDDTNDAGKNFTNDRFGYAYLGGPFIVMTYDNDGWGIARMNNVTAHEVGHIFWATDEYDQGPMTGEIDPGFDDEFGGYLNIQEIWLSGCVMDTATLGCVSDAIPPALSGTLGTYGQIGWLDSDGNSAFDILDIPPETTLTPHADPTNNVTPTYIGTATVAPFPPVMGAPVTINTIADVEYRVDNGSWFAATPVDGAFNETSEAFTFTTPLLAAGNHTIDARAKVVVSTPTPVTIYDASPGSDILQIIVIAPSSSVDPLANYTRSAVFNVFATIIEGPATIDRVELFAMKEGGPWVSVGNDTVAPYIFQFATTGVGVGDGLYRFYSVAHDSAGNVEPAPATADAATRVDTVAPASAIDALPTYETTSSFAVNATASDANGILSVELFYRMDSGTWTSYGVDTTPPYAWDFDTSTTGGDGLYEFYSIAVDVPTNDESQPLDPDTSTVVDTGLPASAPDPVPAFTTVSIFTVTATASDAGSGVTQVELFYQKDGGPWTSYGVDMAFPWSWTFDTATTGGDGSYAFYSFATDTAGNAETAPVTADVSTTVDTVAPASSVGALATFVSTTSFLVTATASDADAVASVELIYRKDGGTWTSYAVDTAFPWSWTFDTALTSGDGSYGFYSIATDAAANGETPPPNSEASTVVDTGPPTSVPGTSPFTNTTTFVVTATATDAGSGVAQIELFFRKDGGSWSSHGVDTSPPYAWTFDAATLGGDGVYEFYTIGTDVLGNVESTPPSAAASTAVDTVSPISSMDFSGTTTTGLWYASIVRVTLSATDATSGVAVTVYRLDGGPWQDYVDPFDVVNEGLHTLELASTDAAGNAETVRSVEFGVDLTPPALAITAPASGAFVLDTMIRISWSVSDATSGLESCSIAVDDGTPVSVGAATSHSLEDLRDGAHRVVVSCTDAAGQVAAEAVAFTYLTTDLLRVTPLGGSWIQLLIGLIILLILIVAVVRWRRRRRARAV